MTGAFTRSTAAGLLACVLLVAGCASPARTSRLTVEDLREVSRAMAESLVQSDAIGERSPESEPWFVSIDKV
ncbi:MAG: hypothetical protein ACOC3G_08645, partial [Phycisphaeraceae bacterium]